MQFFHIPNHTIWLSKKILCQYFIVFFALLETASPLKTFYMSLTDSLNWESEITDILFFIFESLY